MQKGFEKGSKEREMFVDFWDLCQKYWQPEKADLYWKELIAEVDAFCLKYQEIPGNLATKIAVSFIEAKEAELREVEE